MQVREIMSENPACCAPQSNLGEVAQMMLQSDCGEIPVVDGAGQKPVGVVTDRDITCRTVAKGLNPLDLTARDVMSSPVLAVTPETSVEECCRMMEEQQIRRIPVVDQNGRCCGMVAQADIAQNAPEQETGEVVKDISRPGGRSSQSAG